MTNILEAIYNIVNQKNFEIRAMYSGRNRANGMGDALENYIKDAFAGTFGLSDEATKKSVYTKQTKVAEEKGISNCPLCAISNNTNKTKIFKLRSFRDAMDT